MLDYINFITIVNNSVLTRIIYKNFKLRKLIEIEKNIAYLTFNNNITLINIKIFNN